jgi:hypothetical protein
MPVGFTVGYWQCLAMTAATPKHASRTADNFATYTYYSLDDNYFV